MIPTTDEENQEEDSEATYPKTCEILKWTIEIRKYHSSWDFAIARNPRKFRALLWNFPFLKIYGTSENCFQAFHWKLYWNWIRQQVFDFIFLIYYSLIKRWFCYHEHLSSSAKFENFFRENLWWVIEDIHLTSYSFGGISRN